MRFLQRSSRRALGLPASRDAAILSDFVKRVRSSIETELDAPITTIAPAFPRLSPFVQEDVQEANAAYAGLGHGLCESWSFKSDCLSAAWPAKSQSVVYFNFDNSSFSVGAMSLQNAFQEYSTYLYGSDSKLGWWNLPVYETPRAKFWSQIREMILSVLAPMPIPPNRIVLLGEHGADEEFEELVKAAMWEKFEFDVELMLQTVKKDNVGTLAARGAAELGWRDEELKREYISRIRKTEEANEL
jgi:hypothetical protein